MTNRVITGKVLFIGAHPDDIEIGCGGTAAKYDALGHQIAFAIASRSVDPAKARKRKAEAIKAARMLGLSEEAENLFFGDLPDGQLDQKQNDLRDWLKRILARFEPETVFTHRQDAHTDHAALYKVSVGVFQNKNVLLYKIPRPSPDEAFTPNHAEDISNYISKKIAMCKCHASQDEIYIGKDSVRTNGHNCYIDWYGREHPKKTGYAEGFLIHASRSPVDQRASTEMPILNYEVRVVEKADGTRRWEE